MVDNFMFYADDRFAGMEPDGSGLVPATAPAVTELENGGFVTVWNGSGSIRAQIFDADGEATGSSFVVYGSPGSYPAVSALSSGGFVVAWEHSDDSLHGVSARIYDAAGQAVGEAFPLSTTFDSQQQPVVTGLPTGGFVACWTDQNNGIDAQIFDATGAKVGDAFSVSLSASNQYFPQIAAFDSGDFVITWNNGYSVNAQFFEASGIKIGEQIVVSTSPSAGQSYSGVTVLESGNVVVTWTEAQPDEPDKIKAQIFNSSGEKIGTELVVNTAAADGGLATVTALDSGGFVVTWRVDTPGSPNFAERGDINAQVFDENGSKIGDEFLVNVETQLGQSEPQVTSFGSGDFVVNWLDYSGTWQTSLSSRLFFSVDSLTDSGDDYDGTAGRDFVRGLGGSDHLNTLAGDDFIDGGTGADSMAGGDGDDTYVVDNVGDVTTEQDGEGHDTVETNLGTGSTLAQRQANQYQLADYVENLIGTTGGQGLRGNSLNNQIIAADGGNFINASDGGSDYVQSGNGRDVIYYGASLDSSDINYTGDEGDDSRGDLLVIQGDYSSGLTLDYGSVVNVEKFRVQKGEFTGWGDTAGNLYSYDITTSENIIDSGRRLVIQGGSLQLGEHLRFDGAAETDGSFQMFGGHDSDELIGGAQGDHLLGRTGDDTLTGNGGADRLRGGLGADTMDGGAGADTFVYAAQGGDEPYSVAALESTGLSHDTIVGFNFAEDKIDLPGSVTSLAKVNAGALSDASFDADLASAVDASLAANGAVLFTASSGGYSGETFLVVDADGNGSYQANLDFVIYLQSPVGTAPNSPDFFM